MENYKRRDASGADRWYVRCTRGEMQEAIEEKRRAGYVMIRTPISLSEDAYHWEKKEEYGNGERKKGSDN